jgi:hypothetical protein
MRADDNDSDSDSDSDSTGRPASNKKNKKKNTTNVDDDDETEGEGCVDMMKRLTSNCCAATGLCCFKAGKKPQISALKMKVTNRQKKFGVDYLTLMDRQASQPALKKCLKTALKDIDLLQDHIKEHEDAIDNKETETNDTIQEAPPPVEKKPKPPPPEKKPKPPPPEKKSKQKKKEEEEEEEQQGGSPTEESRSAPKSPKKNSKTEQKSPPASPTKATKGKPAKPAASPLTSADAVDEYSDADPSKWKLSEVNFAGAASYESVGKKEEVKGKSIPKAIKKFKANPDKYVAMTYQTTMLEWPKEQHAYTYIHRAGTKGYKPTGLSAKGWMTLLLQEYEALPALKDNLLPKQDRDKYTDNMTYGGRKLHNKSNKPILPGRGMGVVDAPNLKIIGDVDPSDVNQGTVGDCWLLSGISSLAEFDGAVKHLFRKTKNLDKMPRGDGPNMYTITLWDLSTWKEVDVVVDERLCVAADGSGQLLASRPSEDGELWVCYLEKALAAHCGGWDKITGGQCTHAWALMTGCKEQYTISKNAKTGKYACFAKYNPRTKKWAEHANSPHDGDQTIFRVAWPSVGGGGDIDKELNEDELFMKLCAWDKVNYIVGAGTTGASDKQSTGGMVDNHAYSVIESVNNVAGTGIGLIKVRNPWGKGEIEDGMFDDDGPGWDKYPQIKKALNPVVADDGIFWVTKKEFFQFYGTIYLSASDMTAFLED